MSKATSHVVMKGTMPSEDARQTWSNSSGAEFSVPLTSIHRVEADGVRVFYRAAGDTTAPVVLLLHGFPASSFMFRELIPRLADHYRVIAPDLPGFGFTEVPAERKYAYSFDGLAVTIEAFTQALKLRPRMTYARLNRAVAQLARGNPAEAETDFAECLRAEPKLKDKIELIRQTQQR